MTTGATAEGLTGLGALGPESDIGWYLGLDVEDRVAPVGRRLLALLVDQVLAALVIGAALLIVWSGEFTLDTVLIPGIVAVVVAAGQWIAESVSGATLGGLLLRIRTMSARTGRPVGLWRVLVRGVVQGLGALLGGVGVYLVAASGAWDESPGRRGWHDRAAGTVVLRAERRHRTAAPMPPVAAAQAHPPVAVPPTPSAPAPVPHSTTAPTEPPHQPAALAPPVVPASSIAPASPAAPQAFPEPHAFPVDTLPALPREYAPPAPEGLGDLELTRVSGTPGEVALRLLFDTGERIDVTGPGLVGRAPTAAAGNPVTHLIAIDDPAQSVSRVHLAFNPVPGGLVVADQGSMNGTVLVDPSGRRWALPAGQPARLTAGWSVVFGQRTVRIDQA